MGTTTTRRSYAFAEFTYGSVNAPILEEELTTAGLTTITNVATSGTTCHIDFDGYIDASIESTCDAVVVAHQGDDFAGTFFREVSEAESTETAGTWTNKLTLQTGVLQAGVYALSWYCELAVDSVVADTGCQARLELNDVERAITSWGEAQWHHFSGSIPAQIAAGETIKLELDFHKIGASAQTAKIQRARLAVAPLELS